MEDISKVIFYDATFNRETSLIVHKEVFKHVMQIINDKTVKGYFKCEIYLRDIFNMFYKDKYSNSSEKKEVWESMLKAINIKFTKMGYSVTFYDDDLFINW